MMKYHTQQSGFSFVEAIVVAALSALIFGALFSSFQYSLQLVNNSRAKLTAQSVANDRMEYFRSLPYDEVGVVAGFPAGLIPQTSTTTLNGIVFAERVRVDYVDDDADGVGILDSNAITTDYKQVRLEYVWWIGNATSSIVLISNIVPRSIETNVGGGTARINVLDADSTLLPGATVRLFGSSSTFPYDVTNITDATGAAIFAVPADSGYSVEVSANISGNQYSFDGTYEATTTNPNPSSAPFAVLESDVSTVTFQIGELSDLDITAYSTIIEGSVVEEFSDLSGVASSTDVDTALNSLVLADTLGVYRNYGAAYLNTILPPSLLGWEAVRVAVDLPSVDTTHLVQFFTGSSTSSYTLIPDGDLPGNSVGFVQSVIDISTLDISTYPEIVIGLTLQTSDTSETPAIEEVLVFYRESESPRASATLDITSTKTIGTSSSSAPIYKYTNTITTDGSGSVDLSDMEFGEYTLRPVGSFDIAMSCPGHPIVHQAGEETDVEVVLVSNALTTLRVHVVDGLGRSIPGVDVNLSRAGYDVTLQTNSCGQVFFTGGVSDNSDYTLTSSATGYSDDIQSSFAVSGDTVVSVTLME